MANFKCRCCGGDSPDCRCVAGSPFDASGDYGEMLITFSGASIPSTVTTPDYRTAILDLYGNPGDPGVGHPKRNKIYTATNRTRFDIFGEMPSTITGWCSTTNNFTHGGCFGHQPSRKMHIVNKRSGVPSGPALPWMSHIACAFPQSFFSLDRRRSYRGNEIPFASKDESWPYMLPYADGITLGQYEVFWDSQLSWGIFGGGNKVTYALIGTIEGGWILPDVYNSSDSINVNCENHATRVNYAFCAWRGELTLGVGESFPCSREEWVFSSVGSVGDQNWTGSGNPFNLPSSTCVQIGSGGTMKLTSAACRPWLGDAPEVYRVQFKMGPPGFTNGDGNPLTVTTTGAETTTIDLERWDNGIVRIGTGKMTGNWYGVSAHGNWKASLRAHDYDAASSGTSAYLQIERAEPFPDGSTPFHCQFGTQITSDERSPPEHTAEVPRYVLMTYGESHYRWLGCGPQFQFPAFDNRTVDQFAYELVSVTKIGGPYVPPIARCYTTCPPKLKVTWKPIGNSALESVQVMLPDDPTPAGHEFGYVFPNQTIEDFNGFCRWDGNSTTAVDSSSSESSKSSASSQSSNSSSSSSSKSSNSSSSKSSESSTSGEYVTDTVSSVSSNSSSSSSSKSTNSSSQSSASSKSSNSSSSESYVPEPVNTHIEIQYFDASQAFTKRTVHPPIYEMTLVRGCPQCTFTIRHDVDRDSLCVPLGEWIIDDVYCASCFACAEHPCNTCANCSCAPSSMKLTMQNTTIDPFSGEPTGSETITINVSRTGTDPCVYSGTNGDDWSATISLRETHPDDPAIKYVPPIYYLRVQAPDGEYAIEAMRSCGAPGMLGQYTINVNNWSSNPTEVWTE